MNTKRITIGSRVKWNSQAGGNARTKEGVVVATRTTHGDLSPSKASATHFPEHNVMFDGHRWENFGVFVEVRDGKTDRAKPKLYMPKVSRLSLVE